MIPPQQGAPMPPPVAYPSQVQLMSQGRPPSGAYLPQGQLPPPGYFVGQQVITQHQEIVGQVAPVPVAQVPPVPVKGVGIIDKAYLGAYNIKESIKDKIQSHKQTSEIKRMAEAEMRAERKSLEAQQLPIITQMEADRKALLQEHEIAIKGLRSQLEAERSVFDQKQATIIADLDIERKALDAKHREALGALKAQFDARRRVLEERQAEVQSKLDADMLRLKLRQDEIMGGIKQDLAAQRRAYEEAQLQQRAVVNQQFIDRTLYEHTVEAQTKQANLEFEAQRKAVEVTLEQQADMQINVAKEQAAIQREQAAIQREQQEAMQINAIQMEQQAAFQQQQAMLAQQQAQARAMQPRIIATKETQVFRELPAVVREVRELPPGTMSQTSIMQQGVQLPPQPVQLQPQHGRQIIPVPGGTLEHRYADDVKNIRAGQEHKHRTEDIFRDAAGNVISDVRVLQKEKVERM